MTQKLEHSGSQIRASFKNKANVKLARAIFHLISWGTYDAYAAHRWALKLIKAQPVSPEETFASLVNYDWMIEGAMHEFETNERKRKQYERVYAAFNAWRLTQAA